nr:immunoglobulin heavy chain junction region [Mus musculus]
CARSANWDAWFAYW